MTGARMRGSVLAVVFTALTVGGCAAMQAAPEPTLYTRVGGREGIALVVDDFVNNLVRDARVNARFKGMPPPAVFKLKSSLSDQICDATGGPCAYVGRDMKTVHKGMKVSDGEWNATVESFAKALDTRKVGAREKGELLGVLGSMKADIVGQ